MRRLMQITEISVLGFAQEVRILTVEEDGPLAQTKHHQWDHDHGVTRPYRNGSYHKQSGCTPYRSVSSEFVEHILSRGRLKSDIKGLYRGSSKLTRAWQLTLEVTWRAMLTPMIANQRLYLHQRYRASVQRVLRFKVID